MHTYEARLTAHSPEAEFPSIVDFRFNGPLDVVAWAEVDPTIGWRTWPEVWHLDDDRAFACYYKASSLDSVRRWAAKPADLFRSRACGLQDGDCPNTWLIVESRVLTKPDQPVVDESDAEAFHRVREHLGTVGVLLVDAMIFDDKHHWWSLEELTTGKQRWTRI